MFREIILPIFRSTRLCVTACGIMHPWCCRPPALYLLWPALHYALFCCHRLIRELFDYTREQCECSVIFIDEVDSICRQRTSKEQDVTRRWVIATYLKFLGYERAAKMTKWFGWEVAHRRRQQGLLECPQNYVMSHTTRLIFTHITHTIPVPRQSGTQLTLMSSSLL